jgi:hypothetical protein
METIILSKDVTGPFSTIVYGLKDDKVKIISNHQNVLIVENEKGIRFPYKISDLVLKDKPVYIETKNTVVPKKAAQTKVKKEENKQQQLF